MPAAHGQHFVKRGGRRWIQALLLLVRDELAGRGVNFTHAPHMIHRHEDGTEEWMAFFEDNDGRPLALMTQVRTEVR